MEALLFLMVIVWLALQCRASRAAVWKRRARAWLPIVRHVGWDIQEVVQWVKGWRTHLAMWRMRRSLRKM